MTPGDSRQWGSRKVEPPKKRRSARSAMARDAKRLASRLEQASAERREALNAAQPFVSERRADELDGLHQDKRTMRRDIYRADPDLEGRPFYKGHPGRAR